jgi:hypothetical protein
MKEVSHGYLFEQVGPAYFNIPHLATQGTNNAGTSLQGAAQAEDDDAQIGQDSSKQIQGATVNQMQYNPGPSGQHVQQLTGQVQNQMVNFGTSGQIPPSAQKIAPSVPRIRRDIDPNLFNQRLMATSQQGARQANIPPGYHYGSDYNTWNMILSLGYQGT